MDEDDAAARMRDLRDHYTRPVRKAPAQRRPASITPGVPMNLGILEHMADCVAELTAHTLTSAPTAGPAPADPAAIYDWSRHYTADLPDEQQRAREALIYRQGLEHAIAMGDDKVVRPHRCPACRTFGLYWRPASRRAVCVNVYCTDTHGVGRTWSLAALARQHVDGEKKLNAGAT